MVGGGRWAVGGIFRLAAAGTAAKCGPPFDYRAGSLKFDQQGRRLVLHRYVHHGATENTEPESNYCNNLQLLIA